MFVCRGRDELLAHVKRLALRTDGTHQYPLIALEGPAGTPGGYLHPPPPTSLNVIAFGDVPTDALSKKLKDAYDGAPPSSDAHASADVAHFPVGGESDPLPDTPLPSISVCVLPARSTTVCIGKGGVTTIYGAGKYSMPRYRVVEAPHTMEWTEFKDLFDVILYDPHGLLSGWNHLRQWNGTEVAFSLPASIRSLSWGNALHAAGLIHEVKIPALEAMTTPDGKPFLGCHGVGALCEGFLDALETIECLVCGRSADESLRDFYAKGESPPYLCHMCFPQCVCGVYGCDCESCEVCSEGIELAESAIAALGHAFGDFRTYVPTLAKERRNSLRGCLDARIEHKGVFYYWGAGGGAVYYASNEGLSDETVRGQVVWFLIKNAPEPPKKLVVLS